TGAVAAVAGIGGWTWLRYYAATEDGIPWPLRRVLRFNESVVSPLVSPNRQAPEYAADQVQPARFNGHYGLATEMDIPNCRLRLQYPDQPEKQLTLPDVFQGLPRTEMHMEFKCVEGWSRICHFAGVRFSDFAAKYGLPTNLPYVCMETPLYRRVSKGAGKK